MNYHHKEKRVNQRENPTYPHNTLWKTSHVQGEGRGRPRRVAGHISPTMKKWLE